MSHGVYHRPTGINMFIWACWICYQFNHMMISETLNSFKIFFIHLYVFLNHENSWKNNLY